LTSAKNGYSCCHMRCVPLRCAHRHFSSSATSCEDGWSDREEKGRVHLRFTLQFDLRFGACVGSQAYVMHPGKAFACVGETTQAPNCRSNRRSNCKWTWPFNNTRVFSSYFNTCLDWKQRLPPAWTGKNKVLEVASGIRSASRRKKRSFAEDKELK
jgi:hypothetical protein